MGTLGLAAAPLWLPEVCGGGLAFCSGQAVKKFAKQALYGLGAEAALKAITGYDFSEAG